MIFKEDAKNEVSCVTARLKTLRLRVFSGGYGHTYNYFAHTHL